MASEQTVVWIWLSLCAVGLWVSARQFRQGVIRLREARQSKTGDEAERIVAYWRIAVGALGFAALSLFAATGVVISFVYPLPGEATLELTPYMMKRTLITRWLLISGFFLLIVKITIPEFVDRAFRRLAGRQERLTNLEELAHDTNATAHRIDEKLDGEDG